MPTMTDSTAEQTQHDSEEDRIGTFKTDANAKLREAEKAWHAFACALPVGHERERAFEIFENIRTATRLGA